jgi:hypothetical protein
VRPSGGAAASREAGPFRQVVPERDDGLDAAIAVADAVLLEGYLLYPYRRSSSKNQVRWQFGVLLPPAWARAHGLDDEGVAGAAESWWQQTESLLEPAGAARLRVRLRFLQIQRRSVEEAQPPGGSAVDVRAAYRPVSEVRVGDRIEVAFDEAVPCEVDLDVRLDADLVQRGAGPRVDALDAELQRRPVG